MFARGALTVIDSNSNLHRNQARGGTGSIRYELVSNRAGTKWFVRPRLEDKDNSWREALAELILECVEKRKRPLTEIPVAGPEHLIRGKKVARPDMLQAIHGVEDTQSLPGQLPSVDHTGEVRQVPASLLGGAADDLSGAEGHYGRVGVDHVSVPGDNVP